MATEVAVSAKGHDGFNWDRQASGQYLGALAAGTTGAQVRGGVIPSNGNPLSYAQKTGLVGTLKAGRYLLPVADASLGPMVLWLSADADLTHDTAHATNNRTDLIIAEISDVGASSGFAKFRIVKGRTDVGGALVPTTNWTTPNGSGVDLGNGAWVEIARVTINASGGSGTINAVVDKRTYTAAAGGVVRVDGAAATPTLANGLAPYAPVWDASARRLAFRDGTSGGGLVHPIPLGSEPAVSVYTGAVAIPPGEQKNWADDGSPFTYQAGDSYGAQLCSGSGPGSSILTFLGLGTYTVFVQFYYPNGTAGIPDMEASIVRSSDGFTLAVDSTPESPGRNILTLSNPGVWSGAMPAITGLIRNPNDTIRYVSTYVVITRTGLVI